ncbi:MAG: TetR/AcrR family transcriptional regulator [Luminiphilus sp.]|nr:TetR/AcrR family transcriptional regulator [Luminiphilus sp.]
MTKLRGKYASPAQAERRKRILKETLRLLKEETPADISMAQIAECSDVSTKTLYNLFKNRNGLLLAAAAQTRTEALSSVPVISAPNGVSRIIELTRRTMDTFTRSPAFMDSAMSVVVGISAEEEAEYHRVGSTQRWFYEALLAAESEGELIEGTNCLMLSQLLAASQWGVTLMWQKKLISLATLRHQATLKHCLDLIPFCRPNTASWLNKLLESTMKDASNAAETTWIDETRIAS